MAALNDPAIVVLTEAALATGLRLRDALPGAELFGLAGRVSQGRAFDDVGATLRALFAAGRPVIGVCAAGILIRALAPSLASKRSEPPMLAVSEDGAVVVPLLGGHRGANRLAEAIAAALGATAAITTATDRRFGVALDDPPPGWALANPEDARPFLAALLAGERVRLDGTADWLAGSDLPIDASGSLAISVTDRRVEGGPGHLVYHRMDLALGIGCERGASAEEAAGLVERMLAEHDLPAAALAGVFSIDLKMDEPAVAALAARQNVPSRYFTAARLEGETPRLANPSELVFREVGCHGVAEGAALAAAGPGGILIVPKQKSLRVTCAVARAVGPIDVATVGTPRGTLAVVGLGPGMAGWRTAEADAVLREAEDIVGFRLYLDLIDDPTLTAVRHAYAIGAEEARVRAALDLAAAGRRVALVCSGDPGIYAMAPLVFECIDVAGRPDWRRVAVTVVPGVSALQAAAARIGAPLGHDFCAISLSDLLTPWDAIERRVRAAAEGDFVIAFYNPVSRRRGTQLLAARDILLTRRPADTPVVLGRNLGRAGETVMVTTLAALTTAGIDMTTLVLVGSSATRRVARGDGGVWVYTPRGYGDAPAREERG